MSSPRVWLALGLLFVISATTSFFITLGLIPAKTLSVTQAEKPVVSSSQASTQSSSPTASPSKSAKPQKSSKPQKTEAVSTPTQAPVVVDEPAQPTSGTFYEPVDARIMFVEIGAALSWGFNKPTNRDGLIRLEIDSKQKLETKILLSTSRCFVDSVQIKCTSTAKDPVLAGSIWSSPVPFEIDLTKSSNQKPKVILVQFDTQNSEGIIPVKLRFTFADWR